jgi:hypothetical protein
MKPIEMESLQEIHGGDVFYPSDWSGASPIFPPFPYQASELRNYDPVWTDTP